MIQILSRGSKREAFSILDATIAVFISSLLLLAVLGLSREFVSSSNSIHDYVVSHIEKQNQETNEFFINTK